MNILCVCLSATIQRTATFESLSVNEVNRTRIWHEDASGKAVNSQRVLMELAQNSGLDWDDGAAEKAEGATRGGGAAQDGGGAAPAEGATRAVGATSLCPLGKENARHFLRLARRDGLKIHPFLLSGSTRLCLTLLDKKSHTTTEVICDESSTRATENDEKHFLKNYRRCLSKADFVLIAGSKGPFSDEIYVKLCRRAHEVSVPVFADFCGEALRKVLSEVSVEFIKINEEEFLQTFADCIPKAGESGPGELNKQNTSSVVHPEELNQPAFDPHTSASFSQSSLLSAITQVSSRFNTTVIITRGAQATLAATADGKTFVCDSHPLSPQELVNTTACGDTFSAGFLYEFLKSGSISSALKCATLCASRNARSTIPGTIRI